MSRRFPLPLLRLTQSAAKVKLYSKDDRGSGGEEGRTHRGTALENT